MPEVEIVVVRGAGGFTVTEVEIVVVRGQVVLLCRRLSDVCTLFVVSYYLE